MATRPCPDPHRAFNFVLELDGRIIAGFAEVSGLCLDLSIDQRRADSAALADVRRLPGLRKFTNITLKRGIANSKALDDWHVHGSADHRHITVVLCDEAGQPTTRWRIEKAWISKIEGPTLNATGNDVAIETLELTHQGVTTDN